MIILKVVRRRIRITLYTLSFKESSKYGKKKDIKIGYKVFLFADTCFINYACIFIIRC